MFIEVAVDTAMGIIAAVTDLLPEVEFEFGSIEPAIAQIAALDAFLPMHEAVAAAQGLLAVIGLIFAVKLLLRVLSHIPFFGGSGA